MAGVGFFRGQGSGARGQGNKTTKNAKNREHRTKSIEHKGCRLWAITNKL